MSLHVVSSIPVAIPGPGRAFVTADAVTPGLPELLDPAPLPPEWVISGDPAPRMRILTMSADGVLQTGVWWCGPGVFRFDYTTDEIVHLVSGSVVVRSADGSRTDLLTPGGSALFPKGLSTVWTIEDHVHKFFVLRHPSRPARAVRRVLGAVRGGRVRR